MNDLNSRPGYKRLDNFEKLADTEIESRWVENARANPQVYATTYKGERILIKRSVVGGIKVEYEAYIVGEAERIAWMFTSMVQDGKVQVTNANVFVVNEIDYGGRGVATAIYSLIEDDLKKAGGEGVEPHWGSMNENSIKFWKKWKPELSEEVEKYGRLGSPRRK